MAAARYQAKPTFPEREWVLGEPEGGPIPTSILRVVPGVKLPRVGGNELRACRLDPPRFGSARAGRNGAFVEKGA